MRVALLGPVAWRTPPEHYGPWEQVVGVLADGLVEAGDDVTLFATGDSLTRAVLDAVVPHGYAEDPDLDGRVWEALHVAHVLERSGEFDVVHNHLDWLPLAFSHAFAAPMVTTIHGFSASGILPAYRRARSAYVSISDADRAPGLDYLATVHHGVDVALLPAGPGGDGLVSFGRIHPDKGTAEAIAIARRTGRRLVICGIVHDRDYFETEVAPHVDDEQVVFLGPVGPAERARVLGEAAVLLHPVAFDEPFGLSVVESMVCGTPVVAFRRGSMPEVVDEGVTGCLVSTVDEAVRAVDRAARLDRSGCRERAVARFGAARMVRDYREVYARVVASG
ncbi:glycosyl transferase [Knoellia flava TL1]|uniref:Glycosyl transferase n=2 Tax=Knoellia flava TaxID=913969 RepID=A0A8H9FX25_9MICO|nr:glycosyltransferase family 4 protein [Knoellia flava]KGN35194.1 glycosyl transferase [Knoellia flava TL1]GGB89925.1 glycosyl transferase [Knoellia flava]